MTQARVEVRTDSRWLIAGLGIAATSVSFMQTLVVPIQNHLPAFVDAPRSATAWVLTISLLTAAVTTPIAGRLGDIFGKRRIALILLAALTIGSVVAALSDGLTWLLIGRGLQGVSMGLIPVAMAVVGDVPDSRKRHSGIAFISASLGFGGALGLPIAAWIVEAGDWKMLFWASAALGVGNFLILARVVPRSAGSRQPVDIPGAIVLAVGLGLILVAVSQGPVWGWMSPLTVALIAGGVVVLVAWGMYELRIPAPIVDLRQLSRRPLLLVNLSTIAFGFTFFVSEVAFLQILELPGDTDAGLGLSMLWASVILVPGALAMMAAAPLASRIVSRLGGRIAVIIGGSIVGVSYVLTVIWHSEVWHIAVFNCVLLVGISIGYAAIPALVMAQVPSEDTGAANGVNALMRSVGTSSGSTVTGMVLASSGVVVAGEQIPQDAEFTLTFILGAVAAVVSVVLVWFSRADSRRPADIPAH